MKSLWHDMICLFNLNFIGNRKWILSLCELMWSDEDFFVVWHFLVISTVSNTFFVFMLLLYPCIYLLFFFSIYIFISNFFCMQSFVVFFFYHFLNKLIILTAYWLDPFINIFQYANRTWIMGWLKQKKKKKQSLLYTTEELY